MFALFSASAGVFLIGLAARNAWKGSASRDWQAVEGRVLRAFVLVNKDSDGGKGYTPQVEYEYTVAGRRYTCMRLRYGQTGAWNRAGAERTIQAYAEGAPVKVYVNPSEPADAVLMPGTSWGNAGILAAGLVFAAVAYFLVTKRA